MAHVRKERVLSFIYQKSMRSELKLINLGLIGPTTKLQLTYQGSNRKAYTSLAGKDKDTFRIVIGGKMVAQTAIIPDEFTTKDELRLYIKPIKMAFKGLNYHEMGHVLFSDMTFTKLAEYDSRYTGFVFQLFNILEDPVIELNIINYVEHTRPYDVSPRTYINFIKKQLFSSACDEYKDDGSLGSFMAYILYMLRMGKSAIKSSNTIFEKYSAELIPMIKAVLSEPDATERQVKTVKLADWMIHNISEFNWEELTKPEDIKPVSGSSKSSKPLPSGAADKIADGIFGAFEDGDGGADGPAEGADCKPSELEDSSEDAEEEDEEEEEEEEDSETSEDDDEPGDGKSERETEALDDDIVPEIDDCFNDLLNSSYAHEFVIAKDEYTIVNATKLNQELDKQLEQSKDCVQNISKFLTLFKGRKKPRRISGFTSGKLDICAAMQDEAINGCETKLFSQNIIRGRTVDLAISLVCDNSGSMSGLPSTLASIAALALAQACEWSKIPFECSCFTKTYDSPDGISITIIEKSFEDSFEKAKPYFGINDSTLVKLLHAERDIPTFRGNSEEVNLFHIGKAFAKCGHTTKLMFVFCDGATTGSRDSLRKVIAQMQKDGIIVIGIGLGAREVAEIYPLHKIFKSCDDIKNNLAPYLIDTLSKFATKQ